ncbi:histidine phosphatase superfamily [Limtongia smithiae]|uniref:histidine phosphatase superfamily n=1 Tax=Limtongia smithiae TaxID=1125753 RepID=UPI0034CEFD42
MLSTLAAVLASISLASAATSNTSTTATSTFGTIKHYPPLSNAFNDLDSVFNASSGTNGGYYNTSFVADEDYGAYNYCNMPHVRPREYVVPEGYDLQYVEILHRHHKRTPYASNTFPKEDIALYCDDTKIYYYGAPKNGDAHADIWWKNYQDAANPMAYYETGFNGSCQFPQISNAGLADSEQHGKDVWAVYGDLLKFLPTEYDAATMRYRATTNQITSQVAAMLVKAMYPEVNEFSVWQQIAAVDSMEPSYTCTFADDIRDAYEATDEWQVHLNESQELFDTLDGISGVDPTSSGWHSWFDHYFDNLSSRTCHQLPLPCNVTDPTSCITEADAEQVFRIGDYEYNYIFRQAANSTLYSATHYGAFIAEIQSRIKGKIAGSEPTIYRHNIGHDGSVSPLLGALQVQYLRWPGMGSEVIFELWRKENVGGYYIRVLYGGQPVVTNTPMGTLDMIPVETFLEYTESLVGENGELVYQYCTSS